MRSSGERNSAAQHQYSTTDSLRRPSTLRRREIDIGHDKTGPQAAWHLDRVEVTPEGNPNPSVFKAGMWFSSLDGNRTRRVLKVSDPDPKADDHLINYKVREGR